MEFGFGNVEALQHYQKRNSSQMFSLKVPETFSLANCSVTYLVYSADFKKVLICARQKFVRCDYFQMELT